MLALLMMLLPAAQAPNPLGIWQGPIGAGGVELTLAFTIADKDGKRTATMAVPEQGAKSLPCAEPKLDGDKLTLDVPVVAGKFVGKFAKDGKSIVGTWFQAGREFPLTLESVDRLLELKRPQLPKGPFPYSAEDVSFENTDAKVTLAGTLTLPPGDGPFTAVVLVSGSGPQDRDETLFNHKPFLVIADALSRRGIAVLRYDDRGVGKSKGKFAGCTSEDFAADATAGVRFLAKHAKIDPKKIGIVGHSEGGLIAPLIAAKLPDEVAFIVLLAGPGLPGRDILLRQSADIHKASGGKPEEIELVSAMMKYIYDAATTDTPEKERRARIAFFIDDYRRRLPAAMLKELKFDDEKARDAFADTVLDPWMNAFIRFDPRPTLMQVKCPVLALNGGVDLQVSPKENLAAIRTALEAGGNKAVTTEELPKLNHLFQPSETGKVSEYGRIETTFDAAALKLLSDWIAKR